MFCCPFARCTTGIVGEDGEIIEVQSPKETEKEEDLPQKNPYFRHIGVIKSREDAKELAAKLVVSGIVAHADRGTYTLFSHCSPDTGRCLRIVAVFTFMCVRMNRCIFVSQQDVASSTVSAYSSQPHTVIVIICTLTAAVVPLIRDIV